MKSMVALYLLGAMIFASAQGQTVILEGTAGNQALRQIREGEIDYVSASDFFEALGGSVIWSTPDSRLIATVGDHQAEFQWGNPFCRLDDGLRNLVYQPVYYIDDLYLPLNSLTRILGNRLGVAYVYDRGRSLLLPVSPEHNVVRVFVEEKLNGTLLEILLSEPLEYELFVTEGDWVNVTLIGGRVDAARLARERPSSKVRRVRAFQFENSAQISVQMRVKVVDYHHNAIGYPDRIQISIAGEGYIPESAESLGVATAGRNSIDVIVIDPGHGGEYRGAVGKSGLEEKEVVLDIAIRLEELLDRDARFTPVLTRRQDHTVQLEQRALTANSVQGDLFISIHTNASSLRQAGGCETYFLAPAANDAARVTELLENSDFRVQLAPGIASSKDDVDYIVMDLLQSEYLQQSQLLAEAVQSSLRSHLNIRSRGINQAGFAVLNRVSMPSVLVEVAFMSNRVEERLLGQTEFRQSVARAIYDGITDFVELYRTEGVLDVGRE